MSTGCAQLGSGVQLLLDMSESEAILGFMLNYGILNHTQSTFLEVSSQDGSSKKQLNLSNPYLVSKPSRSLVAMFTSCSLPAGHCQLEVFEDAQSSNPNKLVEIVGALVGPEPILTANWKDDAIGSLAEFYI
jgi:hypothetical protein